MAEKGKESSDITSSHSSGAAGYAQMGRGTSEHALHTFASTKKHVDCIVDSGESKHITGNKSEFDTYHLSMHKKPETVVTADRTSQPIVGMGSVSCTPTLTLSSVLHVPSFSVNLMSVSFIIDQLHCLVIFDGDMVMFQEKGTRRILGTGQRRKGLWYLNRIAASLAAAVGRQPEEDILLQHRRLGHMPFDNLKMVEPSLFNKVDLNKLVCDVCEFSKHTRSTYKSIGLRSGKQFEMIHSDVWGPSSTPSLGGYR